MACLIDKGIAFDCANPQQGGIAARAILINYEDWKNATVTQDAITNEITAITLAAGGIQGWEIQVPKSSNIIPSAPLRAIDGVDGFDHTVDVRAATIEQLDRENIEKIRFNKVVMIVEFLEGRAQLYGAHIDATPDPAGVGMRLSDYQENHSDSALSGTIQFIAKTSDNDAPEVKAPMLIAKAFDIDDLLTPTV